MERIIEPEILDHLDPLDPEAQRSRADLNWINRLMATRGWMLRKLDAISPEVDAVIELGPGDGLLLNAVHQRFPEIRCIGYDFVERPDSVAPGIEWVSGDFMDKLDTMPVNQGTVILANLILHHLHRDQLEQLRDSISKAAMLIAVEPDRSRTSLWLGQILRPFVGRVTRSDMMVSICAGFGRGELAEIFQRTSQMESVWLGGRRVVLR
ncbi:MAG: class I SAM-dependent methyltransferase [Verrucomicrobiota bacterium]